MHFPTQICPLILLPCMISSAVLSSSDTGNENYRKGRDEPITPSTPTELSTTLPPPFALDSADPSTSKTIPKNMESVDDCFQIQEFAEMTNCLGVRAVALLDRGARLQTINVLPGVSFVGDGPAVDGAHRVGKSLSTGAQYPDTSASPKSKYWTDLLSETVTRFFETHSLQLRMPRSATTNLQRAFEEGRGKIKKKLIPFLAIMALKIFAILPLILGVVGFLALKALLVGKMALVIAAVMAMQKYSHSGLSAGFSKLSDSFGSASSSSNSYSNPVSSPGGYYRRSIEDQIAAQQMAFGSQVVVPQTPETQTEQS